MPLTDRDSEIVKNYLISKYNPDFIILFGSAAQNRLRPDSDIDLAFLSATATEPYGRFLAAQQLAGLLGRDVDLIDLRDASSVLRVQIIGSGSVLYNANPNCLQWFQMTALKDYALLNEERMPVLKKMINGVSKHDQ